MCVYASDVRGEHEQAEWKWKHRFVVFNAAHHKCCAPSLSLFLSLSLVLLPGRLNTSHSGLEARWPHVGLPLAWAEGEGVISELIDASALDSSSGAILIHHTRIRTTWRVELCQEGPSQPPALTITKAFLKYPNTPTLFKQTLDTAQKLLVIKKH